MTRGLVASAGELARYGGIAFERKVFSDPSS